MSFGGNMEDRPPMEVGASKNDFDMMHVINWKLAEQVIKDGKFEMINGMRVIRLDVAAAEGVLHFVPEPKSPHGVDVSPDGNYLCVGGKLDPHVTIFGFDKILAAIRTQLKPGRYPASTLYGDGHVAERFVQQIESLVPYVQKHLAYAQQPN